MPVSERNRAIFRTMQADVVAYVESQHPDLGRLLENDGALEGPQVEIARFNIEQQRELDPTAPACEWDAPWIPNGDYTVSLYNERSGDYFFRIHLVSGGVLAGKRIVKYKAPGQRVYKGFGFVTKDGGFSLWRRFANQTDQPYVYAVRRLFEDLNEATLDNRTSAEVILAVARRETRMNFPTALNRGSTIEGSWKLQPARCIHCNNPARLTSTSRFPLCIAHGTIPAAFGDEERLTEIGRDIAFERAIEEEQRRQDAEAAGRSVGSEWDGEIDTSTATSRRRRRSSTTAARATAQSPAGPMMDQIEGKYIL